MPRSSRLSPELLETFITVLEAGGDAALAAEQLNINQPSMSKRLALLQRPGPLVDRPWLVRREKLGCLRRKGNASAQPPAI